MPRLKINLVFPLFSLNVLMYHARTVRLEEPLAFDLRPDIRAKERLLYAFSVASLYMPNKSFKT